jgi:sucrose-phosphate synthase
LKRYQALLISDIDHTLIGEEDEGDEGALAELRERVESGNLGFGVATGRSLELVKEVLERHAFPPLDVIVSAVGSEIHYGPDFLPDRGYARFLTHRWKPDEVRKALEPLSYLEPQPPEAQREFKLSYFLEDASKLNEVKAALDGAKLRYSLIYSHGRFLDILPYRASKGKAIRYLAEKWGLKPDRIAVAGDSGNDEEMLVGRFKGIVVGNHQPELEPLKERRGVYFARASYARGVLEGLEHHGLL